MSFNHGVQFIKRKLRIRAESERRPLGGGALEVQRQSLNNNVETSAAITSITGESENYDPSVWDQQQMCRHGRGGSKHQRKKFRLGGLLAAADAVLFDAISRGESKRTSVQGPSGRGNVAHSPLGTYSVEGQLAPGSIIRRRKFEESVGEGEFTCKVVDIPSCMRDSTQSMEESQYVLITSTNKGDDSNSKDCDVLENEVNEHVTNQVTSDDASEGRMQLSCSSLSSDSMDSTSTSNSATHGSYTLWHCSDDRSEEGCSEDDDDLNENYLTPENSSVQRVCTCQDLKHCECVSSRENTLKRKLVPLLRDFDSNESIYSVDFEVRPKDHPPCVGTISASVGDLKQDGNLGVDSSGYHWNATTLKAKVHVNSGCNFCAGCESANQSFTKTKAPNDQDTNSLKEREDCTGAKVGEENISQMNILELNSIAGDHVCTCVIESESLLHSGSYGSCASSWNTTETSERDFSRWEDASDVLQASRRRTSDEDENSREGQDFEMVDIVAGSKIPTEHGSSRKRNRFPKLHLMGLQTRGGREHVVTSSQVIVAPAETTARQVARHNVRTASLVEEKSEHSQTISRVMDSGPDKEKPLDILNKDTSPSEGSTPGVMDADCSRHVAWTLANNAAVIILLLDHKMCEGRWRRIDTDSPVRSSSQLLPDGFSYGEEKEVIQRTSRETKMQTPSTPEKMPPPKTGHKRSKSFGTSVSRAITDAVNKLEEMSHESRNKQYHKLFKFVPEDEGLIVSFSCALVRDILLQGRLYLSENWVCFHSNIFTFETQVSVSMEEIQNITKERTAFVVPNAIGIHTDTHKYVFGSLLSRHSTYKQLVKVWQRRYMLDETTSQDSESRLGSEHEALEGEEMGIEEGEEADIEEEDADTPLLSSEDPKRRLQCEVHTHSPHSEFEERRPLSRRTSSSSAPQMKPSRLQIILAQILTLIQAVLAVNIYKSLRRFFKHQPFLAFSSLLFFVLTVSAAILCYKILTFQNQDESLLQDAYEKLSNLGNILSSHHQHNHDKVSQLQEKLVSQLQTMVQHQADADDTREDKVS